MTLIDKKELKHLADLARIELKESEQEKLLQDLGGILNYVEELKELGTDNIEPMAGGTDVKNAFRADEIGGRLQAEPVVEEFPEKKGRQLKIPPVF